MSTTATASSPEGVPIVLKISVQRTTRRGYIRAGKGVRRGSTLDVHLNAYPTQKVIYAYGPQGYTFAKDLKGIITREDGTTIGHAVPTPHQKALVLHLDALSQHFTVTFTRRHATA